MKKIVVMTCSALSLLTLAQILGASRAGLAQSISPATDGVGTVVTQTGNRFEITGGTLSGSNLYQSFQQFGLKQSEIANFLSNPNIQNILGRVLGGNPSAIDGLIQVTGGNANLFLMNPAGIVFGANASLNVPRAFTATTANGIQVGDRWFGVNTDAQSLQTLIGNPNAFAFATTQPGAIFNAGNLAVSSGQRLTLVGGAVLNTGTLTAPGGTIAIAAVPGEKLVRITPQGGVLSLDLPLATQTSLNENTNSSVPLSLPALLASSSITPATGVTIENGAVKLTASGAIVPTDPGTSIASGNLDVSSAETGGTIHVLGDKVALVSANLNASGNTGGGTVLIGGDYQGKGSVMNASRTFVSEDSAIRADAIATGNGGRAIVWADGTTQFLGEISARGGSQSGDGGFVEVSGKQNLQYLGNVDTSASNGNFGTLLLDPMDVVIAPGYGVPDSLGYGFTGQIFASYIGPTAISQGQLEFLPGNTNVEIQAVNTISILPLGTLTFAPGIGNISFYAGGAFLMSPYDTINTSGRNLNITASSLTLGTINPIVGANPFYPTGGGNINLWATNGGISAQSLNSGLLTSYTAYKGGDITLTAFNGNIAIADFISSQSQSLSAAYPQGGNININVVNGDFFAQRVFSSAGSNGWNVGPGGNITINANNISVGYLESASRLWGLDSGKAGLITLNGVVLNGSILYNASASGAFVNVGSGYWGYPQSSSFLGQFPAGATDLSQYPDNLQFVQDQLSLAGQIARGEIDPPASLLGGAGLSGASGSSLNSTGQYLEADSDVRSKQAEDDAAYEERERENRQSWKEWHTKNAEYNADWSEYEAKRGNYKTAENYASKADYEASSAAEYDDDK